MFTREATLKGAATSGKANRKHALLRYYENPNFCEQCGNVIQVKDNERPAETRRRKFCNRTCSASYNNTGKDRWNGKRQAGLILPNEYTGQCERCKSEIHYIRKSKSHTDMRKFCQDCVPLVISEKVKEYGRKNGKNVLPKALHEMTKRELREHQPSYHYFKLKIDINARKLYKKSGSPYICKVCGYAHHVQICHIKDVKDFEDSALIAEINSLNNLVALCPNHHWEFDHGLLKLQ